MNQYIQDSFASVHSTWNRVRSTWNRIVLESAMMLSIIGVIFVSFGSAFCANIVWCASTPVFVIHNYKKGDMHQTLLFSVFMFFAIAGVVREVLL